MSLWQHVPEAIIHCLRLYTASVCTLPRSVHCLDLYTGRLPTDRQQVLNSIDSVQHNPLKRGNCRTAGAEIRLSSSDRLRHDGRAQPPPLQTVLENLAAPVICIAEIPVSRADRSPVSLRCIQHSQSGQGPCPATDGSLPLSSQHV